MDSFTVRSIVAWANQNSNMVMALILEKQVQYKHLYLHIFIFCTARSCINYNRGGLNWATIALPKEAVTYFGIRSTVPGRIPLLFSKSPWRSFTPENVWKVIQMGPTALRDPRTTEQLEWSALSRATKSQLTRVGLEPSTLSTRVQRLNRPHTLPSFVRPCMAITFSNVDISRFW